MDPGAAFSAKQAASREKTFLAAVLLSVWAPLATGLAVLVSRSTTQLADFVRRTAELVALVVSWYVFRRIVRGKGITRREKTRMERAAGLTVAGALFCSGGVMVAVAFFRLQGFQPGGNVYPGLAIAGLGLLVNSWFWRRYTLLDRERHSPVTAVQRNLYSAKSIADLCVIAALTVVAVWPAHRATPYVDAAGSVAVAGYLLWSGFRALQTPAGGVGEADDEALKTP